MTMMKKGVAIIVDPYSTGCLVAKEINDRGYDILALWTKGFAPEMKTHVPKACGKMNYIAEVDQSSDNLEEIAMQCQTAVSGTKIVACLAGGEAGVDLADALSEHMGLLTNGTDIPNRRDKKLQQELIRSVGMRAVRQAGGDKLEDVMDFLRTESYPIVLKPNESAGSDGVKLCHTIEEAIDHFNVLMNSQMVNGGQCPSVLCQEFLKGKEYVVDHVSLNGKHKTMMVWVYDKRPANDAEFVYYGCSPVPIDSPEAQILIPYVRNVLNALGLKNGPSHGEVIITEDGPCLVEMNCRARGGDGNWRPLCKALNGGYTQVEATADAYLSPSNFDELPDMPPSPFKACGDELIFVSYNDGKVKSTPGYDMIKKLPSFVFLETGVQVGSTVTPTIDLLTGIGSVILMHPDPDVVNKDIQFIRHLENIDGLFDYCDENDEQPPALVEESSESEGEEEERPLQQKQVIGITNNKIPPSNHHHRRQLSSTTSRFGLGPNLVRHMSLDRRDFFIGIGTRSTVLG